MKIRQASYDDLIPILRLYESYSGVQTDSETIKTTLVDMITKGNVLMITDNDTIVGACAGWLVPCGFTKETMFMAMFFYVMESHRRYTVIALRAIEKFIKGHCDKIVFSSPNLEHYEKYNRFYRMQGYRELETHFAKNLG